MPRRTAICRATGIPISGRSSSRERAGSRIPASAAFMAVRIASSVSISVPSRSKRRARVTAAGTELRGISFAALLHLEAPHLDDDAAAGREDAPDFGLGDLKGLREATRERLPPPPPPGGDP